MIHEQYAYELLAMKQADQKMRVDVKLGLGEWDFELDRTHTEHLRKIVEDIGWPTISRVGKEASESAWILVQHAMDDIDFMKHALSLMKEEEYDIERWQIAYLTDRILMMEGKPQIYGTQYKKNVLWKVQNREKLDDLRESMGLDPLESEYWEGS